MAVPAKITLYKKNDQTIEVAGLKDGITGSYLNAATVKATLYNRAGDKIAGLTDITVVYVVDSDGVYQANVPETFDPPAGGGYTLHLDAVENGLTAHLEIACEVKVRKS